MPLTGRQFQPGNLDTEMPNSLLGGGAMTPETPVKPASPRTAHGYGSPVQETLTEAIGHAPSMPRTRVKTNVVVHDIAPEMRQVDAWLAMRVAGRRVL